ncbi:MAG: hypothetical protein KDA24_17960 [Deltaproteobacteria bacterium]|nr:hypothetical protein [Deltaproteobacteria bacterium]
MSVLASLSALPDDGMTVSALRTLDRVIPGEWENITDFSVFVKDFAETENPEVIRQVTFRASELEGNPRYARALKVFTMLDTMDQVAAGATVASAVGGLLGGIKGLGFLKEVTPKPETTQCVDAGLKLIAEVVGFGLLNGMPTTEKGGLTRFAGALEDYGRYDLMRIAAWVTIDGVVPLGADFLQKVLDTWTDPKVTGALTNNSVFGSLADQIPGGSTDAKRGFITDAIGTTGDWVARFIDEKGITQGGMMDQLNSVLSIAGGAGDYAAAALDASTAYYAHTGTQTVARTLARHAVDAQRRSVWRRWAQTQTGQ